MIRTQVILTEEQVSRLKKLANERDESVSALVRASVDRLLEEQEKDQKWARAREVMGKYSSGKTDISENHDSYLAETYGTW